MRAVRFDRFGAPSEVLHIEEVSRPLLAEGEARIAVRAAAINRAT
jgi:NADPH:quinone reductase-like Zn-dependent oxidoreductase